MATRAHAALLVQGVAWAYFFEQEEQCPSGTDGECNGVGAKCTPSFVRKTVDEISACEIDPACSMDDIGGGLKDHPMEAITMILVVGLFLYSLLTALPMLQHCNADMRKLA